MTFATSMPAESMMSPQSPGEFVVEKLRKPSPLQHCATLVLVVDDVLVDEVLLLVVGVGAELELVELVLVVEELVVGVGPVDDEVLDVLVLVVLGPVVGVVELVVVLVDPGVDEELVELVLVVDVLPGIVVDEPVGCEVEVVELVLVDVEGPTEVEVVDGAGCDVELVDEVLVDEVLVVLGWSMVVVVPAPGFFSDGTQRSDALRHVPRNGDTSCSMNSSWTDTSCGMKVGCPTASTIR